MKVLVINAGSSSLKYQLIDMSSETVLAKGLAERIGSKGATLYHTPHGREKITTQPVMRNHTEAIRLVLDALVDPDCGVVSSMSEIDAVGHRATHGGERFKESVLIDDDVIKAIMLNTPLAPLHNPANIMGIEACKAVMPDTPMVAVFDTAFHHTMPPYAYMYALPYNLYTDYRVRRYGFHGTSHRYVSRRTAELMGKPYEKAKIITCHLGNGASLAAVSGGRCVDTSMGFTPLEGIVMGTRSGDIDPAIIQYLMGHMSISITEVMNILNTKSGLLGISGLSNDFRDIIQGINDGNERAQLAFDIYCYHIRKYLGSYIAVMNGVDAIALTAGIAENVPKIRAAIVGHLGWLGVQLDEEKNQRNGEECRISKEGSKVEIWVVPTNEELTIARDTKALVNGEALVD